MRVLDLFSGIGGFSLGLERAGMETVAFCERDEFCQRVLAKHWPGVPIHDDIKTLTYAPSERRRQGRQRRTPTKRERLGATILRGPPIDLVCGGFPCQPFSQAGQRRGADDDRHLWPEMLRIIREVQPTWVIGENVIGLETMGLKQCVSDLESDGFAVQVFDIPACGVGALHRRHRLWIVGHSERNRTGAMDILAPDVDAADAHQRRQQVEWERGVHDRQRRSDLDGCDFTQVGRPTEPPVCRADDGISFELDPDRGLNEYARTMARAEGISENHAVAGCVRALREYGESGAAPPQLRRPNGIRDSLSALPHRLAQARASGATDEELLDLWDEVSAEPLQETQDMFAPVLERAWQAERKKAMGQRVSRLRALGNAVVPQIVEIIGRGIMKNETALAREQQGR